MTTSQDPLAAFWQSFASALADGTPLIEALHLAGDASTDAPLRDAVEAIHQGLLDGGAMAEAMAPLPDVFPPAITAAVDVGERQGRLDQIAAQIAEAVVAGDLSSLPGVAAEAGKEAPAIERVHRLIVDAVGRNASDIHFDPVEGGGGRVRVRVDGLLQEVDPIDADLYPAVVGRLKIMAAMDLAENALPQDGRIVLEISGKPYDLRVSCLPTVFGERVVCRILSREQVLLKLERLGLSDEDLVTVRALARRSNGLVICNGPTGSGKTTVLYSVVSEINCPETSIMSIEDPVEYTIPGIAQTQVNPRKGLNFARAVRAMLRQDPDVLLIGEIRDYETLITAAQAALTGHLVLTTLHSQTSPGAVRRLLDIGLEPFLVNSALAGVVSIRLARVLCGQCSQPAQLDPMRLPAAAVEFIESLSETNFRAPGGCENCRGTGYRGRTGLFEVLVADDRIRQAVAGSGELADIRNAAVAGGMKTLMLDGLAKAAKGITSVEEVLRICPPPSSPQ